MQFNSEQRQWIGIGYFVLAGMMLYPPWVSVTAGFNTNSAAQGDRPAIVMQVSAAPIVGATDYDWFFSPPRSNCRIDLVRLGIEVAMLGIFVILMVRSMRSPA